MKYYRQFLSLFLVFVLSLGIFSITANAESIDNSQIKVNIYPYNNDWGNFGQRNLFVNSELGTNLEYPEVNSSIHNIKKNEYDMRYRLTFVNNDGSFILKSGRSSTFNVNNMAFGVVLFNSDDTLSFYNEGFEKYSYYLVFEDGTNSSHSASGFTVNYNESKNNYVINLSIPAQEKNVSKIVIYTQKTFIFSDSFIGTQQEIGMELGTNNGPLVVNIDQSSEESGFLSGILEWVKDISADVSSGFANMVKGITELPEKLWTLISDGLKNLFVPDEQYMSDYSDKWDELLSQRFGAIYDVSNIIREFVERIQVSDKTNTIYLPSVSLESVGIPFTFGGYDIQVVPSGFDILVEICKKIISIACTFLFLNSLRKRYDEIMGVEQ